MYYTVTKYGGHVRTGSVFSLTLTKCSQMSGVFFHSVIYGLGFFHLFYDIEVKWQNTIKHAFSMPNKILLFWLFRARSESYLHYKVY